MLFSHKKVEWEYYVEEMKELEPLANDFASFKPVEIKPELIKRVYTSGTGVSDAEKPILATDGLYNCTGILAYDLNKEYAFLGHSYGNELYGIDNSELPSQIYRHDHWRTPKWMPEASVHALEMLDTLSKKELYQLKVAIIIGSKPNVRLVGAMINTMINLRRKKISIESIELRKPFVDGIHTDNDVNHGKDEEYYDLCKRYRDKEIVQNNITGEFHSYDRTRGASFAFDVRDGKMLTYNSDNGQYYTYDEGPSIAIKMR